ncbi:hypothetical protein [Oceanibaculum pacificum]|uniref:hypothetical protein n=1 Tax=Oceanibaculum pacificum TaxID=580166 RepID=UPI0018DBBFCC|nr:hypothetical protein [Oceanibaculum pacificum]
MTIPTFRRAAVPGGGALRHELIDGAAAAKPVLPPATPSGPAVGGAAPARAEAVTRPVRSGVPAGKPVSTSSGATSSGKKE